MSFKLIKTFSLFFVREGVMNEEWGTVFFSEDAPHCSPPPNKILDIDRNLKQKTEVKGREIIKDLSVRHLCLESYIVEQIGLECEAAVFRQEREKESWLKFFLMTQIQKLEGNSWKAFETEYETGRPYVKDMGKKTEREKGPSCHNIGSLHVSKNKVL